MDYPDRPGWKKPGTSQDAAQAITSCAKTMRDRVLAFLTERYPSSFTADQIAVGLGASILTVRPRVSELRRSDLIEPTAERRKNRSGLWAHCWRAVVRSGGKARIFSLASTATTATTRRCDAPFQARARAQRARGDLFQCTEVS
jgi:hypothetical protein